MAFARLVARWAIDRIGPPQFRGDGPRTDGGIYLMAPDGTKTIREPSGDHSGSISLWSVRMLSRTLLDLKIKHLHCVADLRQYLDPAEGI